jgi:hypothetical protein
MTSSSKRLKTVNLRFKAGNDTVALTEQFLDPFAVHCGAFQDVF